MNSESLWKTTQKRNCRIAEEQKWRNERHKEQMLYHVGAKKGICEAVEGRCDSDPDDSETKKEGD